MGPRFVPLAGLFLRTNSYVPKLGLFSLPTPFVTWRPYTLIFNGSVKSFGAVGLALSGSPCPFSQTAFPDSPRHNRTTQNNSVRPPFHHQTVPSLIIFKSRSERNEADHKPTALFDSAIEKSMLPGNGTASDEEFYLGVLRDGGALWQLHRILTGRPSRGTMALDTETAPGECTYIQVIPYHDSFGPRFRMHKYSFPPAQ